MFVVGGVIVVVEEVLVGVCCCCVRYVVESDIGVVYVVVFGVDIFVFFLF